jgi:hypothetical protein
MRTHSSNRLDVPWCPCHGAACTNLLLCRLWLIVAIVGCAILGHQGFSFCQKALKALTTQSRSVYVTLIVQPHVAIAVACSRLSIRKLETSYTKLAFGTLLNGPALPDCRFKLLAQSNLPMVSLAPSPPRHSRHWQGLGQTTGSDRPFVMKRMSVHAMRRT